VRAARQGVAEEIIDALIAVATVPRTGNTCALDATGQWAWTRGLGKRKKELGKNLAHGATAAADPGAPPRTPVCMRPRARAARIATRITSRPPASRARDASGPDQP
jgi:hypothetical protein